MSYQRSIGHSTVYDVIEFGYNYRMDDIRSSIGIVQLNKIKSDLELREKLRFKYIYELSSNVNIVIPFKDNKNFSSNYIFPIYLKEFTNENRNYVRESLSAYGIQTSVHYPPVHKFSIYRNFTTNLPNTEKYCSGTITLPMHGGLSDDEVSYISKRINAVII
jgi:dTDP-4-amino-4,6-dideoxygalactose transaminase